MLAFATEQRPRRDVEPGVLRQWTVVVVDAELYALEDVVGDHAQIGDAEQDVGGMLVEGVGQAPARGDDRHAVGGGVVPDEVVRCGDEDDVEPVGPGDVGALGDERFVPDERAANGAAAPVPDNPNVTQPGHCPFSPLGVFARSTPQARPRNSNGSIAGPSRVAAGRACRPT